jgi:penicillin-binding protein 1C
MGYSAEYTVGVWIGNVNQKGSPDLTGSKAAAPLLIDLFNSISTSSQKTILPMPGDVQVRDVCANSGLLPAGRCTRLIEDYYSVRRTFDRHCEFDREALVSPDGKMQFCPSCLGGSPYRTMTIEDYPPELLSFWDDVGKPVPALPPHNPKCTRLFTGAGPRIVSPSQDMTYFIVSPGQKLSLQANSGLEVREQIWYIDEKYLGRRRSRERLFVSLQNGDHTITCMDDRGRISSVKITVKYAL